MIIEERLKELITKNTTVYVPYINQKGCAEIPLTSNYFVANYEDRPALIQRYNSCQECFIEYLDYLFESKEDARWSVDMCAKQTIRFAPPNWEEFNNNKYNKRFVFIDKKLQPHRLWVDVEEDETCNLYNKECIYIDTDIKALASKENYRKVVEYARKMFLGEVEND